MSAKPETVLLQALPVLVPGRGRVAVNNQSPTSPQQSLPLKLDRIYVPLTGHGARSTSNVGDVFGECGVGGWE